MIEWLPGLTQWGWFIIGLVLLAFELIVPIAFFLWLGVSALVTAVIVLIAPDTSWQLQFLIFSVLSVISIMVSKKYLVKRQTETDVPNLNRRAQQYVGRVFSLSEDIQHGRGKIQVDDTYWKVTGPELKKGSEVRIVSADGSVFEVEAV